MCPASKLVSKVVISIFATGLCVLVFLQLCDLSIAMLHYCLYFRCAESVMEDPGVSVDDVHVDEAATDDSGVAADPARVISPAVGACGK